MSSIFTRLFPEWAHTEKLWPALGYEMAHGSTGPDEARAIVSWKMLSEAITWHRLAPPDIQVVNNGKPIPKSEYLATGPSPRRRLRPVVDPDALTAILQSGATLVVNDLDEMLPSVGKVAYELQSLLKEHVQANAYATWGQSRGFNAHWDDHDVLVLQVEGTKHWDIFGPGKLFPVDHTKDADNECPERPIWSGTLQSGDALYLPRGWWHSVRGDGEVSLHLTFGFQRRTGAHYLEWIRRRLSEEEFMRRDLDRYHVAHTRLLKEALSDADIPDVAAYLAEFQADLEEPRLLNLGSIVSKPE